MKWDIDKAILALEAAGGPGTVLERILINPEDEAVQKTLGLKLSVADRAKAKKMGQQLVAAWAMGVGKSATRKLFFYAWTIREAYLMARRGLKKLSPSDLAWYGVAIPKKRNSFAAAKRKKKTRV